MKPFKPGQVQLLKAALGVIYKRMSRQPDTVIPARLIATLEHQEANFETVRRGIETMSELLGENEKRIAELEAKNRDTAAMLVKQTNRYLKENEAYESVSRSLRVALLRIESLEAERDRARGAKG